MEQIRVFSTFTGIGGFEKGIIDALGEENVNFVGYSEILPSAIAVYKYHYPTHHNYGDITKIDPTTLPGFDLLVGGFPCQSFSCAGSRKGFNDTRGTLFFDVARILKEKTPKNVLLENVKGLLYHDDGNTFATILSTLDELGYDVQWCVFNSKYHGVPQNRNRLYITGHLRGKSRPEVFNPLEELSKIIKEDRNRVCASTLTREGAGHWAKTGSNVVAQTLTASFHKRTCDGNILEVKEGTIKGYDIAKEGDSVNVAFPNAETRRGRVGHEEAHTIDTKPKQAVMDGQTFRLLTPLECERLQGFPDGWTEQGVYSIGDMVWNGEIKINKAGQNAPHMVFLKEEKFCRLLDSERYKLCGNAVTTKVVEYIIKQLYKNLI